MFITRGGYSNEYHVGMALGGAMGVAWWEVIGYHTIYPYHCLFQRYHIQPVLVFIQSLMHL